MNDENRKVVIIGTGMVGMSYAYALLNQNACDELVLIDIDRERAEGEAMDLNHGLAFSGSHMKIYAGEYRDCANADIVCICAGVAQKPGESRLELLGRNAAVFKSVIDPVTESGFNGIFLVATNPVDIMTHITCTLSGFNARRVLGSGTALDTARLRYLLGNISRSTRATCTPTLWVSTETANLYRGARPCWPQSPSSTSAGSRAAAAAMRIWRKSASRCAPPHRKLLRRSVPPIMASAWRWFVSPAPSSETKAVC